MSQPSWPYGAGRPQPGSASRAGRGARHCGEQAVCDEYVSTMAVFGPLGPMTPAAEKRIRPEALAEFAAEHGVSVGEGYKDYRVIEALDRTEACDMNVAEHHLRHGNGPG